MEKNYLSPFIQRAMTLTEVSTDGHRKEQQHLSSSLILPPGYSSTIVVTAGVHAAFALEEISYSSSIYVIKLLFFMVKIFRVDDKA